MTFKNLLETLKRPVLTLPVGDKTYEIPEVSAEVFVRLVDINARMKDEPTPDAEVFPLVFGADLYGRMQSELTQSQMHVVASTAYLWQLRLHELAEEFWNSGGKALRARAQTRTRTPRKTLTAAGTTTQRRASGSGTSTRKNSSSNATA